MNFSKVYYFFTPDRLNDIYTGFIGFLIEILILSVLVPFGIWLFNRQKIKKQRFYGHLFYLKSLYNISIELAYFFEMDKEKTEELFSSFGIFQRYWFKHSSEIKIGYSSHPYYNDLEAGLYCLIHNIGTNSCKITQDVSRLSNIIDELNKIDSNIDRGILIYSKESVLADSLLNLNLLCKKILEYLNRYKKDNLNITDKNKLDLITGLDIIIFSFLSEFYERSKIVDKDFDWFMLKQQFTRNGIKNYSDKPIREVMLEEFYKINRKNYDKDFARGQLYLLINIIRLKLGLIKR